MAFIQYSATQSSCGSSCSTPAPTPAPTPNPAPAPVILEFHACMGLNACRAHDRFGTNSCAGTGYCATASTHSCHTLNNCKGQGGCGLYGTAEEQDNPGANECSWQGSCAVPIQAERFSTMGSNQGKSTWLLARRLFEERMAKAQRKAGSSPFKCGPPQAWLSTMNPTYGSCGSSGNVVCSFGFNNKDEHGKILCEGGSETGK